MRPGLAILSKSAWQFPNAAHDDQVDAMTQALLRWHVAPHETTVLYLTERVQISPY
jgi:hypothetical protein